jgi:hypothetical protein
VQVKLGILAFAVSLGTVVAVADQVVITDDFNDDSLDTTLWNVITIEEPFWAEETNQRLELSGGLPSPDAVGAVMLTVPLAADSFDVQVDFEYLVWPGGPNPEGGLVAFPGAIDVDGPLYEVALNGPDEIYASFDLEGGGDIEAQVPNTHAVGGLRLTGSGSTIAAYYWSGGTWVLLQQFDFPSRVDEPLWVGVFFASDDSDFAAIAFDDFTAAGTFAVEVLVAGLMEDVLDLNLQSGINNSFDAKLDAVLKVLDDVNANNDVAAINAMSAFMNQVEAQRGGKLTTEQADSLIEAAQAIITALGGG